MLKTYPWKAHINYRQHPEYYQIGKGEQGVLICQPYKNEILPYWRFKNFEIAQASAEKIFLLFLTYLKEDDFVGADMARKFLQMGFTRAKRYANYKGGKKYHSDTQQPLPKGTGDPEKEKCAELFYQKWQAAETNADYSAKKKQWKNTKIRMSG